MRKLVLLAVVVALSALGACSKREEPKTAPAPAAPAAPPPPVAKTGPEPAPAPAVTPPAPAPEAPPAPKVEAESKPAPESAEKPAPAEKAVSPAQTPPAAKEETYTVVKGDTLYSIARAHNVKPAELAKWNGIGDASRLRVGQKLALKEPAKKQ